MTLDLTWWHAEETIWQTKKPPFLCIFYKVHVDMLALEKETEQLLDGSIREGGAS